MMRLYKLSGQHVADVITLHELQRVVSDLKDAGETGVDCHGTVYDGQLHSYSRCGECHVDDDLFNPSLDFVS